MYRLIVGIIAWYVFGVIYTEVLNNFNLFNPKLKVYLVAGVISMVYLFSELFRKHFQNRVTLSAEEEKRRRIALNSYELFICIICVCLIITVPFLWLGVIKKLAMLANEGKPAF